MIKGFLKYYLIFITSLFIIIVLSDYYFQKYQKQETPAQTEISYLFKVINDYCHSFSCSSNQALPFEMFVILEKNSLKMPEESELKLSNGDILSVMQTEKVYYYQQLSENLLVRFGPVPYKKQQDTWYTSAFYFILAAIILAGLYPLFRDMYSLIQSASMFSNNRQLEVLALPKSRFFQPVNDAFYWMIQKIARLLALQKELSDTLSHELNTSISRLNFSLALLSLDNIDASKAELQQDIDDLKLLVEEHLTFSQLEHETPTLITKRQSLLPIIDHYITLLGQYSSKKIIFENKCTTELDVDKRSISKVIKNLVDNAIKYSHSTVKITLFNDENRVVLQIDDDGAGIGKTKIDDLFLPYTRTPELRHISGYGLGLAITRKIIDRHGGVISARASSVLSGACFQIELPINNS